MKKIGLVLSGGGVRGVAHLGALKAMGEFGIEPTVISGTSAGSLVGAMYSAGHSLDAIYEFFKTTPIFKVTNFATRKPGFIDSDKFVPILQEYFPEDDFAALKKKFYATATDIIRGRSVTFSEGELIRPLLASSAVPVVFTPVKIGDTLFIDGGALNNFPVEPLHARCDVILGVNVHPLKDTRPEEIKSSFGVMERIFHLSVFSHSVQKYHLCNMVIQPQALAEFGTFERGRFEDIFEIGYQAAIDKKQELLRLAGISKEHIPFNK